MRILVLLEASDDVRVPPRRDPRSGRVRPEWQVRRVDPASGRALDLALALKAAIEESGLDPGPDRRSDPASSASGPAVSVVALALGSEVDEALLRQARARGCDEAVRVWDEGFLELRAPGAAAVLAAAARAVGADLVMAGAASADTASGQVGVLVADHLGLPCVTQVAEIATRSNPATAAVRATRALAGGFREFVEVPLPAVVTVAPYGLDVIPLSFNAVLDAQSDPVPVWGAAELGIPAEEIRRADRVVRYGGVRVPRPSVRYVPAPDPAAAAFDRIGELVRGTVRRREGRMSAAPPEKVADVLFEALRDGGWLDHLREESPR